jgi:hypothetical protein
MIIIFFTAIAGVSAVLGRGKALGILLGSFMGYVVATELGSLVLDFAKGYSHTENFSLFLVKVILFFATIVILNAKTELSSKGGNSSLAISMIFGLLAAAFMITAILSFMEPSEKANILADSFLIILINSFKLVWIVASILFLFVADFIKSKVSR